MTIINDTDVPFAQHPMLFEWRPGRLYQTPLTKYNLAGDDAAITNSGLSYLFNKYGSGVIDFGPFNFNMQSTVSSPYVAPMYLKGAGPDATILNYSGNGDAIRMYNNYVPGGGSSSILVWGGGVSDMSIYGTNAGASANGIHTGDMKRARFTNLNIHHFQGTAGLWVDNTKFWTEDCIFDCHFQDCNALQLDVHGGTTAHDNCFYHLNMGLFCSSNQNAITLANGANLYHTTWWAHGGIRSSTTATTSKFLNFLTGSGCGINHSFIIAQMESDGGNANTPQTMFLPSGCNITGTTVFMDFMDSYTAATIGGAFSVSGFINGDNTMANHVPASPGIVLGSPFTNPQNDAIFCLSGGTVTAVLVNGVNTGLTSGPFYVPQGGTIQINGTVLPTINVYGALGQH